MKPKSGRSKVERACDEATTLRILRMLRKRKARALRLGRVQGHDEMSFAIYDIRREVLTQARKGGGR